MFILDQRFSKLVDECLQRLDQGEDLLDVLADHPDYQERIKPLLLVAMASRAFPIPIPNQTAKRFGKNHLLSEMAQMEGQETIRKTSRIPSKARFFGNLVSSLRSTGLTKPAPNFRLAMVALIMIFGAGFFTMNASAGGFSGEFINYLTTSYQYVLEVLSFEVAESDVLPFGQFQFFSGKGLGFDNQVAQKADLLLDVENEEDAYLPSEENGGGKKNQNNNGSDQEELTGASANDPQDQDNNGLALGHDKEDQDNNGLALGLDNDQDDPGLALGHDKDQDNNGLALGHDKDEDGMIKDKEDKDKKVKDKEDKIKDKIKDKDDEDD